MLNINMEISVLVNDLSFVMDASKEVKLLQGNAIIVIYLNLI